MCSYSTKEDYRSSCGCTECKCKRKNRIEESTQFLPKFNELVWDNFKAVKKEESMLDLEPDNTNHSDQILRKLERYFNQEVYLTGSQFFVGKGDDYDFFTKYDSAVEDKLLANGFTYIDPKQYLRLKNSHQDIVSVYRKHTGYGQIDIQLVMDPCRKDQIQNVMHKLFMSCGYCENKQSRALLWELADRIVKDFGN